MMQDTPSHVRVIDLPLSRKADWKKELPRILNNLEPGPIEIDCQDWLLGCREIKQLAELVRKAGLQLNTIRSILPETLVSASALGHQTNLIIPKAEIKT